MLQRDALNKPRPELVVKVDRSGLNEHHPIVEKLYAAIDNVLKPSWPPRNAARERTSSRHRAPLPLATRSACGR